MKVVIDTHAWLPRHELTPLQVEAIRNSLLIVPRKVGDFDDVEPEPLKLWVETDTHVGVPREFFLGNRKAQHEMEYRYSKGAEFPDPDSIAFVGKLRDEQQEARRVFLQEFERADRTGGLLRASPGWGKTTWSCGMIASLKVPTLVVVHKEFLMDQWRERLGQFLPAASVGLVQQDVCDFEGRHVVLAMVHSLAAKDYPAAFYKWPGLVITDECHRIGAPTWAPVAPKFPARWRIGISATPRRKDGAQDVFFFNIGPILFDAKEQRLKPKIKRVWSNFRLIKTERFNPNLAPRTLVVKFLIASRSRNDIVADQIVRALAAGRKVLVLSERLKHLEDLGIRAEALWMERYPEQEPPSIGSYVGGTTPEEREEAAEAQLILATSSYAQEGLDIPALDTIVLATPMSDVEQAVGRILRPHEGKREPVVVDIRDDNVPVFRKAGEARDRQYARIT